MKDKLELQKQYIEVKKKYEELSEKYWNLEYNGSTSFTETVYKPKLEQKIKDTFILLKSLTKQIYYER